MFTSFGSLTTVGRLLNFPCFARPCGFALAAMKKTVLKVNIYCQKCKKEVLKAVTKLTGIDQVTIDGEKVTVVGNVDPVLITEAVRKIGKVAEIESVGPPKPPEPRSPVKNPQPPLCYDYCYCHLVPVSHDPYDSAPCSIL